jgi:Flp pilus assembly pilin Flp
VQIAVALAALSVSHRHEIVGAYQETVMKAIFTKLVKDEQGGEVLEYALIMGLIVVACIAVIGTVGGKVLARWNSVGASM